MAKELNEKQKLFCENYVANGFNATKAYLDAYESDSPKSAAVSGCELLRKASIQEYLKAVEGDYRIIGQEVGINKKLIMERLRDQLFAKKKVFFDDGNLEKDVDDNTAINNAIVTYLKLIGDFAPEKKDIKIEESAPVQDLTGKTPEELEKIKQEMLLEMSK